MSLVEEIPGFLQLYDDGTVVRNENVSNNPIGFEWNPTTGDNAVSYGDFNFKGHLQLRVFKPQNPNNVLMPLIVFIRGGGFCVGSREWLHIHATCVRMASELGVAVVCPDHRLAPEHRLPAAVDDVADAIRWVVSHKEEWPSYDVNLGNIYVVGDSSGGNIAHHLAIKNGGRRSRIQGYVLLGPFFGGVARTNSENVRPRHNRDNMTIDALDRFWRLALPLDDNGVPVTMDDPLANPMMTELHRIDKPIMVIVGEYELLKDRALQYADTLTELGKHVVQEVIPGSQHGLFSYNPDSTVAARVLHEYLRPFIFNR